MKRYLLAGILCIDVLLNGNVYAIQPVDVIRKDPVSYFVKQGPAQCGPSSFYMIFHYYEDNEKAILFTDGMNGVPFSMRICDNDVKSNPVRANESIIRITEKSPVSRWMKGTDNSTGWEKMTAAIRNLHYINNKNSRERFYQFIDSYDNITGSSKADKEIRRSNFIQRIVPGYLDNNRPVIVHLKRSWPFSGHYIVIVGYDKKTTTVFYMDPSGESSDIIKKIQLDDFLNSGWYSGESTWWWGPARWSGRWIGFYREKSVKDK